MKPTWQTADGAVQLALGDCLAVLADLPAGSVDTVITDPPYGLEFMGKDWDHGVPGEHYWREVARVAKPGAMMLCFGGTRTFHRLACAIEDAGWEIRDCLMWLYGQGFPKSHNISGAIDKALGHGNRGHRIAVANRHHPDGTLEPNGECLPAYEAKSEAAKVWNGWGTSLKPAWEPIIFAMKPLDGTFAQNALAHGVAGLNIDGARIGVTKRVPGSLSHTDGQVYSGVWGQESGDESGHNPNLGRFPANLVLSHTPDCRCLGMKRVKSSQPGAPQQSGVFGNAAACKPNGHPVVEGLEKPGYADADGLEEVEAWQCVEGCPVKMLDEQSGDCSHERNGLRPLRRTKPSVTQSLGLGINNHVGPAGMAFGDSGGASRFFMTCPSDVTCILCGMPYNRHGETKGQSPCQSKSSVSVEHAANDGSTIQATIGHTVHENVQLRHVEQIAHNAKSAANLCDSCATAFAHDLVATWPSGFSNAASGVIPASTQSSENSFQIRNLASCAAILAGIGTIPTIQSLSTLFGCVLPATVVFIKSVSGEKEAGDNDQGQVTRFLYSAKASRSERGEGNTHPTVKPLKLMEWLCRLTATPTGGTVLDPFLGSGTTALACLNTGRRCIGIEREPSYFDIAVKRIEAELNRTPLFDPKPQVQTDLL